MTTSRFHVKRRSVAIPILALLFTTCEEPTKPDTTPPTVSISSPLSGETVSEVVTIAASADDDAGIRKVLFFVDDSLVFNDTEVPYQYEWSTYSYDDRSEHTIRIIAYDMSGNSTESVVGVVVDNTGPYLLPVQLYPITYENNTLVITWSQNFDADFSSYSLNESMSEEMDGSYVIYSTEMRTDTSFVVTSVASAERKYYVVAVEDSSGLRSASNIRSFLWKDGIKVADGYMDKFSDPPLSAQLFPIKYDDHAFVVAWSRSADFDFRSYRLHESTSEDMTGKYLIHSTDQKTDTSFVIIGITSPAERYYTVTVEDLGGLRSASNIQSYEWATVSVVDGYMDKISYYPGEMAKVYINAEEEVTGGILSLYSVNGSGVDSVLCHARPQIPTQSQPWQNGFGYDVTFEYEVPDLKSGFYRWENNIPFIIKSNYGQVDAIVVFPSNTMNAYTKTGGKSLYEPYDDAAQRVSFLRPMLNWHGLHVSLYEWLDSQTQYDVGYVCDGDLDEYTEIDKTTILVITGHSEYWTRKARENFDRFVDEGNHALVLSGNTMWWQVRYDEDKTQLICNKYWFEPDPFEDPLLRTVHWNDPALEYPIIASIGADFDHGGYGMKLADGGWDGYKIASPESPLLEGTGLSEGDVLPLPTVEYDGAPTTGFDENGYPIFDYDLLKFQKLELIGFDLAAIETDPDRIATFIVFQKNETSGIVVNTASTDWCGTRGIGSWRGEKIEQITMNMFDKLLSGSELFGGN